MFGRKRPASGECCGELAEVVGDLPDGVEPLVQRNESGVLMMTVGLVHTEDGPGYLDQAVMHCPFCGTRLQTAKSVRAAQGAPGA